MWQITLRRKYPSHFPVGSRSCIFAGPEKAGSSLSLYVFLSLLLTECQLCQFTPLHVWRHLSIFQISHFGANDPPWRKQFLQCGNSQISIKGSVPLPFASTEEASLIGRLHLKSFHNYTIILKMHVCMLLSLHQFTALSAQLRLAFLSVDANSPHLAPNEAIIAHIQANTLLWEVLPS